MEQRRNNIGTIVEHHAEQHRNDMGSNRKNGTKLEHRRNTLGTKSEENWNNVGTTLKQNWNKLGTTSERNWNEMGTNLEQHQNTIGTVRAPRCLRDDTRGKVGAERPLRARPAPATPVVGGDRQHACKDRPADPTCARPGARNARCRERPAGVWLCFWFFSQRCFTTRLKKE